MICKLLFFFQNFKHRWGNNLNLIHYLEIQLRYQHLNQEISSPQILDWVDSKSKPINSIKFK